MTTNNQEVFEVVEYEKLNDDNWLIRGRVYETIKIGDILYGYTSEEITERVKSPFQVIEIKFYGKNVLELTRGTTGELLLTGEDGQILTNVSHLFA